MKYCEVLKSVSSYQDLKRKGVSVMSTKVMG